MDPYGLTKSGEGVHRVGTNRAVIERYGTTYTEQIAQFPNTFPNTFLALHGTT